MRRERLVTALTPLIPRQHFDQSALIQLTVLQQERQERPQTLDVGVIQDDLGAALPHSHQDCSLKPIMQERGTRTKPESSRQVELYNQSFTPTVLQWVDVETEIVDPNADVAHARDKIGRAEGGNGRQLVDEVQGIEEISDRVYREVEDAGLVDKWPELLIHQATNTEESGWRANNFVLQCFIQRPAIDPHLPGSQIVNAICWKRVAVYVYADLRRQTEEVKGLFWPVEKFEL